MRASSFEIDSHNYKNMKTHCVLQLVADIKYLIMFLYHTVNY